MTKKGRRKEGRPARSRAGPVRKHVRLNQLVRLIEEHERGPLTGFEVWILGHKPGRPDGIRIHSAPPAGHSLEMVEEGDNLGAGTTVRDGSDLTWLHRGD